MPLERTEAQHRALATAQQVADELQRAQSAVLALPLYNFGVSQHVKAWIDLALVGAPQGTRLLEGTPTVLVTTRGGAARRSRLTALNLPMRWSALIEATTSGGYS